MSSAVIDLTSEELKSFIETHRKEKYLLVDVRQPHEYKDAHIAGARLLPFHKLLLHMSELPRDRDIIFYCRNGKRSQAAALFARTSGAFEQKIYNLSGGILDWKGVTLADFPDIRMFNLYGELSEQLYSAMDLEKGAYRFYSSILDRYGDAPFLDSIEILADAEEGHARLIYEFWKKEVENPKPFLELFDSLPGDILEGGQSLAFMLDKLNQVHQDACVDILEMALQIEFKAYELYLSMANMYVGTKMEETFYATAQSEKEHIHIAAEALQSCRD